MSAANTETTSAPTPGTTDPRRTGHRRRLIASWAAAAILLIAAWFVVGATPTPEQTQAPFEVTVPIGEWGTGRNIRARVVDAKFADALAEPDGPRPGNWLVVDIEAAAVTTTAQLSASLTINGATYQSSERTVATMFRSVLVADIPTAGALYFELPPEVPSGSATVQIGVDSESILDTVIVVPIEVDPTDRVPVVQTSFPTWAQP